MSRHAIRFTVAVLAVLLVWAGLAPAHSATQTDYKLKYCYSGTYEGSAYADATNGRLYVGWCSTSSGKKATTMTVKYHKQQGNSIRATFGYEWTDADGINTGGRHWDSKGAVTIAANTVWGARFKRSPAEARPNSKLKCMRGLMKVGSKAVVYSTRIVCP